MHKHEKDEKGTGELVRTTRGAYCTRQVSLFESNGKRARGVDAQLVEARKKTRNAVLADVTLRISQS